MKKKILVLTMIIPFFFSTHAQKECISKCTEYLFWHPKEGYGLNETNFIELVMHKDSLYCSCITNCSLPQVTFQDMKKNTISSGSLSGKILIVNFWFTGCHACLHEFKALKRISEELLSNRADKYVFLSITFDTEEQVRSTKWWEYIGFSNIIPNAQQTINDFGINSFPSSMVIDAQSCVYPIHISFIEANDNLGNEEEMFYKKIKQVLSEVDP